MEAMKCDRCGKYVDGGDIPEIRGWRSANARRGDMPTLKMDLCDACYKALEDFLENGNEKKDCCIDCEYFNDKEYYADNTETVMAVAWGSCKKCQRNFTSTNPYTEVPGWCPLKGDKEFHCGVEESGFHAYNCNDCPNKCDVYYQWDKEMKAK